MIVTITLNPSIDSAYFIDHFQIGYTNRSTMKIKSVGGKGINAGRTAALSGSQVLVAGLLAGHSGEIVAQYLSDEQLFGLHMQTISGETRHAITIMHDGDIQTEIVEKGPKVSNEQAFNLLVAIRKLNEYERIDAICISGSANTSNKQLYLDMLTYIKEMISDEVPVFMDVSGDQLVSLLGSVTYHATFIKPNLDELSDYLNYVVKDKHQAFRSLQQACFSNIPYVLVSCGSKGAVCKVGELYYDIEIPAIEVKNPTGSGDATVGGFIHAVVEQYEIEDVLKYAMACGMSNAQHDKVGVINPVDVANFIKLIKVTQLN